MSALRSAVVGLKGMGQQHLKALAENPRADLVAVCDLDRDSAREAAAAYGARAHIDYRDLLASAALDAIVFATPHHLHAPMALDALQAGVHTFVEKPIANRVSDADRMVALAESKELVLAVGHNYRTFPVNVRLKELLPQLGPIQRVLWQWLENRPEAYYDRDIWRSTWRHAGGGVLMNQTRHDLDLMCWLFGPPAEVSAMICNRGHQHEVEDTAIACIRFASGALANVHVPDTFRLGLYDRPGHDIIADAATGQPQPDWRDIDCADAKSPSLPDSFVAACLDGDSPITDGASARNTIERINAIILSGVRKKVVACPIDRDEYDELLNKLSSGKTRIERE